MISEPTRDDTLVEIERLADMLQPLDVRANLVRAAGRAAPDEHSARRVLRMMRELLMEQGIKT
jgi:hypothetical protein